MNGGIFVKKGLTYLLSLILAIGVLTGCGTTNEAPEMNNSTNNTETQEVNEDVIHVTISRSEEHTSELQSRGHLVCRLLLEKNTSRGWRPRCCAHPAPAGPWAGPARSDAGNRDIRGGKAHDLEWAWKQ